jgi:CubicO group peptidase (beta-lactamase class C family)
MRFPAVLTTIVLLASCPAAFAAVPPDSAAFGRALDACVAPLVRDGELSGQLIVARGGEVLAERAWGMADRERRRPMTATTRLNIASITKPVNQLVLLHLMVAKTLAVTDTIGTWLPGYPHGRITVAQLLNHESGIPHRVTTDRQEESPLTAADVTALAGRKPLDFEPGSQSRYSSGGYTVLAHVMEVAAHRSWADLVRGIVLQPAGLEHTVPSAGLAEPLPERAQSYMPGADGPVLAPRKDYGFLAGAGSMWSTARDLHRLAQAIATGDLGATAQQNLLRRGGLHWSGSTNGFFSYLDYDTTSQVTVVFLGNLHTGAPGLLHAALPKLLSGEDVAPLEAPRVVRARPAAATLRRYEGRYDIAGNLGLPVTARDGVVWVNDWVLRPTSDTTFYSPRDYGTVAIARDSTGALAGLNWIQGGVPFLCPRVGDLAPESRDGR